MCLLTEEFAKGTTKVVNAERKSRHLYDLYKMAHRGVGEKVLASEHLYRHVIKHRQYYSRYKWFDYGQLQPENINFVPTGGHYTALEKDYQIMKTEMIYGQDVPAFSQITETLFAYQERFRKGWSLQEPGKTRLMKG